MTRPARTSASARLALDQHDDRKVERRRAAGARWARLAAAVHETEEAEARVARAAEQTGWAERRVPCPTTPQIRS